MEDFLKKMYKYLNLSTIFFDACLKQNPIRNRTITPIEMKILYGLKYENLKTQRDIENHYNMYRSTIMTVLKKLELDGLLKIEIKSHKNRPITLTQAGNETIESAFVQLAAYYKNMVKNEMAASDEDNITHECITTVKSAYSSLGRFAKYLPYGNKKI